MNFYNLRQYYNTINYYDEASKLDQKNTAAYSNKGYSLEKLNNYKEAIKCMTKLLAQIESMFEHIQISDALVYNYFLEIYNNQKKIMNKML